MKKILTSILLLWSSATFACAGGYWEGMEFYNLFMQTNISATEFYPFLRDEYNTYYGEDYYDGETLYPIENINLWGDILVGWNSKEIQNAIYGSESFDWTGRDSAIEKRAKIYIEFAQLCSSAFDYRKLRGTWDYDEIRDNEGFDSQSLLSKADSLLNSEKDEQLRARYYYQIVRILHYAEDLNEAISFYKANVDNKITKDEIYYYITDHIAGCYYSLGEYNRAAYLFTKVFNNSIDRKKSAFSSFKFCSNNDADGNLLSKSIDDKKDLLLIKSLRDFSDEINNLNKFIALDANDQRVELLFMRALSNVEREVWPKNIGTGDKTLPFLDYNKNYENLLIIAEQQAGNSKVENRDFWKISSSYLSFIKQDITLAKSKLDKVTSFSEQKKALSIAYTISSWESISSENENYIAKVLADYPEEKNWSLSSQNDLRNFILDKIAHTYYKNDKIAKSYLVHNSLESIRNISSWELLDALEKFYYKPNKSKYEKVLLNRINGQMSFIEYVNLQKGVYYLYHKNPELALEHFNKSGSFEGKFISNSIFSNNTVESFNSDASEVMVDEVYKADLFSFIEPRSSLKGLASNLIELKELTSNEKQWKAKLANYLLANYYFNISNTGYYRGILTMNNNIGDRIYIDYASDAYYKRPVGEDIIRERSGFNLHDISFYEKHYFGSSDISMEYYQEVINLSTDKELNARCLYMMAKCELNNYYNNGGDDTFDLSINDYNTILLPKYKSFKLLKEEYSDTKFHNMIIKECSYFRGYSDRY